MAKGSDGHVHVGDVVLYPKTIHRVREEDAAAFRATGLARRRPPDAIGLAHARTEAEALVRLVGSDSAGAILEELRKWLSPRVTLLRPGTLAAMVPRVVRNRVEAPTEHLAAAAVSLRALLGTLALAHYAQVLGRIEEEGGAEPLLGLVDEAAALVRQVGTDPPAG